MKRVIVWLLLCVSPVLAQEVKWGASGDTTRPVPASKFYIGAKGFALSNGLTLTSSWLDTSTVLAKQWWVKDRIKDSLANYTPRTVQAADSTYKAAQLLLRVLYSDTGSTASKIPKAWYVWKQTKDSLANYVLRADTGSTGYAKQWWVKDQIRDSLAEYMLRANPISTGTAQFDVLSVLGNATVNGRIYADSISNPAGAITFPDSISVSGVGIFDSLKVNGRAWIKGPSAVATVGAVNKLTADGTFATSTGWQTSTNWTIGSSKALHSTGVADNLAGTTTVTAGVVYQVNFTTADRTTGSLLLKLGTNSSGTAQGITTNAAQTEYVVASANNDSLYFVPTSDYNGSVDGVTVYAITPSVDDVTIEAHGGVNSPISIRTVGSGLNSLGIGDQAAMNNTTGNITAIGYHAGKMSVTANSVAIGSQAAENNLTGNIVAVGTQAAQSTLAGNVTAVGYQAAYANTAGGDVVALGYRAAYSSTTGVVTAVGDEAALRNTTGSVTAVGYGAARENTTGTISAFGHYAGLVNTTGIASLFGYVAGYANTTGNLSAFGHYAGYANTTGTASLFGYEAGMANTTGELTAFGYDAARSNITGRLTAYGHRAAYYNTDGKLLAVGYKAGMGETTANAPVSDTAAILIGDFANRSVVSGSVLNNYVGIGDRVQIDKSNQVKIGNSSITETYLYGNLGLTCTPDKKLTLPYGEYIGFQQSSGDLTSRKTIGADAATYQIKYVANTGDTDANIVHQFISNKGGVTDIPIFSLTRGGAGQIPSIEIGQGQNTVLNIFTVKKHGGANVIVADTVGNGAFSGFISATDFRASDSVSGVSGAFSGQVSGTNFIGSGFFSGTDFRASDSLSATTAITGGTISGTTGTFAGVVDISSGAITLTLGADNSLTSRTNSTDKLARVGGYHYTNSEEPVGLLVSESTSSANLLTIGGGSSTLNTATSISFRTAITNTTTTGTVTGVFDRADGRGRFTLGTTAGTGAGKLYAGDSLYLNSILFADASRNVSAGTGTFTGLADIDTLKVTKGARISGSMVMDAAHHAFGVNEVKSNIGVRFTNVFTSTPGNNFALGLDIDPTITGSSTDTVYISYVGVAGFGITTAASKTVAFVSALHLAEPNITIESGGAVTRAATLYIDDAPTEGATNAGIYLRSGNTILGELSGNTGIGAVADVSYKLKVKGGNGTSMVIDNDGTQYTELDFANNGTTKYSFYWDNVSSTFVGSGKVSLINGNIGIGLTPPTTGKLSVKASNAQVNIFEGYRSASATAVASIDTNGRYFGANLGLGTVTNFQHVLALGGTADSLGLNIVNTTYNANRSSKLQATDTSSATIAINQNGAPWIVLTNRIGNPIWKVDTLGTTITTKLKIGGYAPATIDSSQLSGTDSVTFFIGGKRATMVLN